MSGLLNGHQHKVLEAYPHALHVQCYVHVLNMVLSQSLTVLKNAGFSSLNVSATFTLQSTKRTYALIEYLKRKIPSLAATR
jgi:hypothetical protein